jgi:hypothetical protein
MAIKASFEYTFSVFTQWLLDGPSKEDNAFHVCSVLTDGKKTFCLYTLLAARIAAALFLE